MAVGDDMNSLSFGREPIPGLASHFPEGVDRRTAQVPEDEALVLSDGTRVNSLGQLVDSILRLTVSAEYCRLTFANDKDDVADWIEHTLRERTLADELRSRCTTSLQTVFALERFIHGVPVDKSFDAFDMLFNASSGSSNP